MVCLFSEIRTTAALRRYTNNIAGSPGRWSLHAGLRKTHCWVFRVFKPTAHSVRVTRVSVAEEVATHQALSLFRSPLI